MAEPDAPGTIETRTVEVFADVVCPFTHVGLRRLFALRADLGRPDVLIRVRAWPLELVNGEPLGADAVRQKVEALRASVAPEMFEGFDPALFPMTSLPALALEERSYRLDPRLGEDMSGALRNALFEDGRDISDPDVLREIAGAFRLPPPRPDDSAAVRRDLDEGRRRGVLGSPHFFVRDLAYFCPTLQIEQVGGHVAISFDEHGFDEFAGQCFGEAPGRVVGTPSPARS